MGFEVAQIGTMFGSAYLLKGDRVALVDTLSPMGYRKLVRTLKRNGVTPKDVEFVLLTHHHFDHAGNAARIKELSGATVTAGALDAPVIEGTEGTPDLATSTGSAGSSQGFRPRWWCGTSRMNAPALTGR